jgi:hypothetical protein
MLFCSFTSNKDPDPGFAITLKVKEDVGQTQDVGLLQRRTRLARQAAHRPILANRRDGILGHQFDNRLKSPALKMEFLNGIFSRGFWAFLSGFLP